MYGTEVTSKDRATICAALQHPLRVRILEALEGGDRSPSQFLQEGLFPAENFKSFGQALSSVAYHFRELQKAGCIEVVGEHQRRGAIEKVYRSCALVEFTDDEFAELPLEDRERLSRSAIQAIVARAENSMRAGRFDARTDRYLVWMPVPLDERGWAEASASLDACYAEIKAIRDAAQARLEESGESPMHTTISLLGFESPPPPPPVA
jgi:DNA-binding transcriptional ArsR family regulator